MSSSTYERVPSDENTAPPLAQTSAVAKLARLPLKPLLVALLLITVSFVSYKAGQHSVTVPAQSASTDSQVTSTANDTLLSSTGDSDSHQNETLSHTDDTEMNSQGKYSVG
jgi:hypothetical protein